MRLLRPGLCFGLGLLSLLATLTACVTPSPPKGSADMRYATATAERVALIAVNAESRDGVIESADWLLEEGLPWARYMSRVAGTLATLEDPLPFELVVGKRVTATAAYAELGAALSGIRADKIIEPFEEPIVYGRHENYHFVPSYSVAVQLDQAGTVDLPELKAAVERARDSVQADAVMRVTLHYGTRPVTSLMVYETGRVTATLELEIMSAYDDQPAYSSIIVNALSDDTYAHWFTADAEQFPNLVSQATEHALAKLEERVLGPVDS